MITEYLSFSFKNCLRADETEKGAVSLANQKQKQKHNGAVLQSLRHRIEKLMVNLKRHAEEETDCQSADGI